MILFVYNNVWKKDYRLKHGLSREEMQQDMARCLFDSKSNFPFSGVGCLYIL